MTPPPDECWSLGQAAYERDDLPAAIAAFRQGLEQSPTHPQFRAALEECRASVSYPEGITPPTLDLWQHWLSPSDLLILGCCCGVVVVAGWLLVKQSRRWGWGIISLGFIGWLMLAYASFVIDSEQAHDHEQPVRVLQFDCPVYRGNSPNYPTHLLAPLSAGVEVRVVHTRGVMGPNRTGWPSQRLASHAGPCTPVSGRRMTA